MNYLKTGLLMALMAGLFLAIGGLVGGKSGLLIGLAFSLLFNFGTYWFSEKIAIGFARGVAVPRGGDLDWLHRLNDEFSRRAGIPSPNLYLSPDPQPNAFACGRGPGHASVCVNHGLIANLSQREVAGVLAHELAHVKNRDTLTMTIVASFASAIMFISRMAWFIPMGNSRDGEGGNPLAGLLVMILGPIAAMLIQMGVSRVREFEADRVGSEISGDPNALADALENLHAGTHAIESATAQPATAHMYISNPFNAEGLMALFSTHPPMRERVRRLRAMQGARQAATAF
jgi:heat shock protein HtpX